MDSTFIHYAILGILQGIFEWLPVSSQGIVALASKFLIEEFNPIDIALFLHIGTFFAVLIYFRKDWKEVAILKNPELLRFLIITTIISLVIGYLLYKLVINIAVGNMFLVIMGFALLLTAYFQKKGKKLEIGFNKLAIITGFLQGLAVIPGFSRSGATIFGLSLGKLSPSEILKISYMMSVPVVLTSSSYFFLTNSGLIFAAWPALVFSFLVFTR
jgi:undecaprenyl-diphosphatase